MINGGVTMSYRLMLYEQHNLDAPRGDSSSKLKVGIELGQLCRQSAGCSGGQA